MDIERQVEAIGRQCSAVIANRHFRGVVEARDAISQAKEARAVAQQQLTAAAKADRDRSGSEATRVLVAGAQKEVDRHEAEVTAKRQAFAAAVEAAQPRLREALDEPMAELISIINSRINELERLLDPAVDLLSAMHHAGLAPHPVSLSAAACAEMVRAMRRTLGGR